MKFTFTSTLPKITVACSTDKDKPTSIHNVKLDVELGELQASDSFVAVRIPVEAEKTDRSGVLATNTLKDATTKKLAKLSVKKADHVKLPKGQPEFPNLPSFWPTQDELKKGTQAIAVNVELLRRAAEAVGAHKGNVELVFLGVEKPILVRPIIKDDAPEIGADITRRPGGKGVEVPEALVMPLRATPSVSAIATPAKTTAAKKATAAAPVDESEMTAGQKAAATKRRNAEAANGGDKKTAAAKGNVAGAMKAVAARPARGRRAAVRPTAARKNGAARPTWSAEVLSDRARKAAETRKRNAAAAAA